MFSRGSWRNRKKTKEDALEEEEKDEKLSKAEEDIFNKIFEKLIQQAPEYVCKTKKKKKNKQTLDLIFLIFHRFFINLEKIIGSSEHDELCSALLALALQNGTAVQLCKIFIEEEFKKFSKEDPGSIMRGNSVASKLTKIYLGN